MTDRWVNWGDEVGADDGRVTELPPPPWPMKGNDVTIDGEAVPDLPMIIWDDPCPPRPRWWQFRRRRAARRWEKVVQRWWTDRCGNGGTPRHRWDTLVDGVAVGRSNKRTDACSLATEFIADLSA